MNLIRASHAYLSLIATCSISFAQYIIHSVDDWAANVAQDKIKNDELYIAAKIIELHPYGYDLMGEPKRFQGELTTNDIAIIFEDI